MTYFSLIQSLFQSVRNLNDTLKEKIRIVERNLDKKSSEMLAMEMKYEQKIKDVKVSLKSCLYKYSFELSLKTENKNEL